MGTYGSHLLEAEKWPPHVNQPRRRRSVLTRSSLTQLLDEQPTTSVRDLVDRLAGKYEWTPSERQEHTRRLSDIRAGMKAAARKIRDAVPLVWTEETARNVIQKVDKQAGIILASDIQDDE